MEVETAPTGPPNSYTKVSSGEGEEREEARRVDFARVFFVALEEVEEALLSAIALVRIRVDRRTIVSTETGQVEVG